MIFDCLMPHRILPLRGDFPSVETYVRESFTESDLDQIAPLAPGDANCLGEFCCPSYETLLRVQQRIEAARILKYGNGDN